MDNNIQIALWIINTPALYAIARRVIDSNSECSVATLGDELHREIVVDINETCGLFIHWANRVKKDLATVNWEAVMYIILTTKPSIHDEEI